MSTFSFPPNPTVRQLGVDHICLQWNCQLRLMSATRRNISKRKSLLQVTTESLASSKFDLFTQVPHSWGWQVQLVPRPRTTPPTPCTLALDPGTTRGSPAWGLATATSYPSTAPGPALASTADTASPGPKLTAVQHVGIGPLDMQGSIAVSTPGCCHTIGYNKSWTYANLMRTTKHIYITMLEFDNWPG